MLGMTIIGGLLLFDCHNSVHNSPTPPDLLWDRSRETVTKDEAWYNSYLYLFGVSPRLKSLQASDAEEILITLVLKIFFSLSLRSVPTE